MGRNVRTSGVVLHVYRVAEYHKGLVILSPDLGVFHATAFGACKGKSKLSGVSESFIEGDFYLYHDPVKDRYKVTEIVPLHAHQAVRDDLDRYYTALFWAELVMKSFGGGGEFSSLYRFLSRSLEYLETAADREQLVIQFVWRYLGLIGFQPDIRICGECGRVAEKGESLYLQGGQLVGPECAASTETPVCTPAARSYLLHTSALPMEKIIGVQISPAEKRELKRLLFVYIEDVIGHSLTMLQKGYI